MSVGDVELADLASSVLSREANALTAPAREHRVDRTHTRAERCHHRVAIHRIEGRRVQRVLGFGMDGRPAGGTARSPRR